MKLVSLFSGCGGMDLGFKQAGYDIIWANDFDCDAQKIYELNIGQIDPRDICLVDHREIPDCDILTAGFPCQPFSNAGKRRGVFDERGNLYKECLRIVEEKAPRVVLFENVRGILSTKDEHGGRLIESIINEMRNMNPGYNVVYKLINASDYNVPQNRYRVFIVGIRKDLGIEFQFPQHIDKHNLEVGFVLDGVDLLENQVDWELSPQAKGLIQYIPEGGSWKDIPYEVLPPRFRRIRDNMKKYRSPNFYRRFARNEINGTITASAQPENCGIIHPVKNRRYTIREIARIQSFPDDFKFANKTTKDIVAMYKVIGNAVPPLLAKAMGEAIKKQIFS